MKRVKKKFEGTAWKYENMYPSYVSIVKTGANWIPFSTIKFAESDKQEFTEGYEVSKVIFPKTFGEAQAKTYLDEKGFTDYAIQHSEDGTMYVENSASFTDTKPIEMGDITVFIGKTSQASTQVKTKIEEAEPIMKLDDTESIEKEVVIKTSDEIVEEVVTDEVTEEVTDEVEDTASEEVVTDEVIDDEANFSDSTEVVEETTEVKSFSDDEVASITKAYLQLKFAEQNGYLVSIQARKAYMAINSLAYSFIDDVYEALGDEQEFSAAVRKKCSEFGDAVVAVYSALSSISPDVVVADGEGEDMQCSDDTTSTTEVVNSDILKLQEQVELLTNKIVELENSTPAIDNEVVLQQYSKADVSAFDKSSALEETSQPKPLSNSAKNLFGLS